MTQASCFVLETTAVLNDTDQVSGGEALPLLC